MNAKLDALETELSRANELLQVAKGKSLQLGEKEVLSLSPTVARASAMLQSGDQQGGWVYSLVISRVGGCTVR